MVALKERRYPQSPRETLKLLYLHQVLLVSLPKSRFTRYEKVNKRYMTTDCQKVVGEYNRHMGSVDFIDSIMGR